MAEFLRASEPELLDRWGKIVSSAIGEQDTSGDLDAFADRVLAVFGPREDDVALLALRRR